jgi:pseudo-response regulator 5
VAAVADGMKAWEVMRGRAYAFDLVLTEVAMPSLSGIQLLSRIVAADECKNIPVISKPPPTRYSIQVKCFVSAHVPRFLLFFWIKSTLPGNGLGLH